MTMAERRIKQSQLAAVIIWYINSALAVTLAKPNPSIHTHTTHFYTSRVCAKFKSDRGKSAIIT